MTLFGPLVSFDSISLAECNRCLVAWNHAMGPWRRPTFRGWFHGLRHGDELVGVTAAGDLIRETCAGFTRDEAVELARLCAARRDLNRVVLRLWREFVFPALCRAHGWTWAVSYQDRALHTGDLYRFDGWVPLARSRSGTDTRPGAKRWGRDKTIWGWCVDESVRKARRMAA